jgi:hypothetical protein
MKFLGSVIITLAGKNLIKTAFHSAIVKECTRLFQHDIVWQKTIAENKQYARAFNLSALIKSENRLFSEVGENFGALLLMKVHGLRASDIVSDEGSIARIEQA